MTQDNSAYFDTIQKRIKEMLSVQAALNSKTVENWTEKGLDWRTAIFLEGAELVDHLNWKWWKKSSGPGEVDRARMEAVDIWHFLMSYLIDSSRASSLATDSLVEAITRSFWPAARLAEYGGKPSEAGPDVRKVSSLVQGMIRALIDWQSPIDVYMTSYADLLSELGMSFDDLYRMYIGKVQLNLVRWENDYGRSYEKTWFGEEDNDYLARLIGTLDIDSPLFAENVLAGLRSRYADVLADKRRKEYESALSDYDAVAERL